MHGLCFFLCLASLLAAADYKAGVAKVAITPEGSIRMSGYISRKQPSSSVAQDLWAKALAIEDTRGRVVILTLDLSTMPREMADAVAARLKERFGLQRERVVLNVSHTHSGPVVPRQSTGWYAQTGSSEEAQRIQEYNRQLTGKLVSVAAEAIRNLAPADLYFGNGQAGFAVNRREKTPNGIKLGVNPDGPTDHDVPVLKVMAPDGKLKAVLFGYACHNTVLGGGNLKISGDYAGFAEAELEKTNPGAVALFFQLCAGNQNPNPHGTMELAERHGNTLRTAVNRTLQGDLRRVRGPIRTAFRLVDLPFAPYTRQTFEARLKDPSEARALHAKAMLQAYDEGRAIRQYPYPVQAFQFGNDLTIVALGGEVVVEYALAVKREFGSKGIIVAAYSNDVMCYIPTPQMLKEGGHEADFSMVVYGQPGPWDASIQERILSGVRQVMKTVGRRNVSSNGGQK